MDYIKRTVGARKRIALIAHDHKKTEMVEWAMHNKDNLKKHQLIATGSTGRLLEEALDYPIQCLMSGPLGGDQQIGAMVAEGKIDLVIFFWDPMEAQPHDPDIKALLRLVVVWNIPMACDRATADFLMTSPLMHKSYEALIPDYQTYLTRQLKFKDE